MISSPFDAEPLTDEERDYLDQCGFDFPHGTMILKTPVRLEVWQPDGEHQYIPVKSRSLDGLEESINYYLTHVDE